MKALQEGLSLKLERFASPLNHSEHLEAYFSRYEEDGIFGANVDAFSCRWAGPSQCNLEYESDAMDLAVRWALASATETKEPSLTAFMLPQWDMDAYRQYMNSPLVHLLLRVPEKHFRFKKPEFWRADGGDYASHPGWDVDIFIVSNEAGLQYVKPDLLISRLREASLAVAGHALTTNLPQKSYSSYTPYQPFLRPFRKL